MCQGQLCHLTCEGGRDLSNHTRTNTIQSRRPNKEQKQKNINLTPKFLCKSFLTTLPHFLLSNLMILKVFPKAFSTGMKPSKCPALTRLWQCSEVFRKLSEIFGSHQYVSGKPSHDKVKISRIWVRKSWQVYNETTGLTYGPVKLEEHLTTGQVNVNPFPVSYTHLTLPTIYSV